MNHLILILSFSDSDSLGPYHQPIPQSAISNIVVLLLGTFYRRSDYGANSELYFRSKFPFFAFVAFGV